MPLQNHIHLDLATAIGGAPENAPLSKWVVTDRLMIPVKFMALRRGLTGVQFKYRLTNGGGIVRLQDFQYTVKVQPTQTETLDERIDLLLSFDGADVRLVDVLHPANGQDHTPSIRKMVASIGEFAPVSVGLPYFLVDVELKDDSL
jgi:hypothetical protein